MSPEHQSSLWSTAKKDDRSDDITVGSGKDGHGTHEGVWGWGAYGRKHREEHREGSTEEHRERSMVRGAQRGAW